VCLILSPASHVRTFVSEHDIRGRHHDVHRLCGPDCNFMERSSHKWPARKLPEGQQQRAQQGLILLQQMLHRLAGSQKMTAGQGESGSSSCDNAGGRSIYLGPAPASTEHEMRRLGQDTSGWSVGGAGASSPSTAACSAEVPLCTSRSADTPSDS